MKKRNLCLYIAGALFSVCASAANDAGSLHTVGAIEATTCTINPAELTRTIPLGEIDAATATAGSVISDAPMNFDFTSCPTTFTQAGVKFYYTPDAGNADYLANAGTAKGVLLGISKASDTVAVPSETTIWSTDYDGTAGTATVQAKVNAYRTSDPLVAGDIQSVSQVAVYYQ